MHSWAVAFLTTFAIQLVVTILLLRLSRWRRKTTPYNRHIDKVMQSTLLYGQGVTEIDRAPAKSIEESVRMREMQQANVLSRTRSRLETEAGHNHELIARGILVVDGLSANDAGRLVAEENAELADPHCPFCGRVGRRRNMHGAWECSSCGGPVSTVRLPPPETHQ